MSKQTQKLEINENLRNRIEKILDALNEGLIERKEIMDLAFLSAIAGESIFMLGPPGVAKSLIARRLKFGFKNAKSFEYLMHRFSTPDEVFGPISISKLKNEDKMERVIEHYLPGANIAFLDEIWKAGPSIQNTLLTIINEKVFRNGEQELKVDLFGILAASNELPEKGQGLDALWDRFLIRVFVKNIEKQENFEQMILNVTDLYEDRLQSDLKISKKEYYAWQIKIDQIEVPREILDLIHHIRVKIEKHNEKLDEEENEEPKLYISDRRWKKNIKILRTAAFLNGRQKVDLMDCFLIPSLLWDNPDQIDFVFQIVKDCIQHQGYTIVIDIADIEKELKELAEEINSEIKHIKIKKYKALKKYEFSKKNKSKFYKIKDYDEYSYIKISEYNSLSNNKSKYIQLYDNNEYGNYEFEIMKVGTSQISIDGDIFSLILEEKEEKVILSKKPHQLLLDDWDKRIQTLIEMIQNNIDKINNYVNVDLKYLKRNIFVAQYKSAIILNKIEELKISLQQIELKCREQKDIYHNVEEGVVLNKKKTRRSKRG